VSNVKFPFWQDLRKLLVNRQDGTYAERVEAYPPVKLMTDDDSAYSRLRVDVGQTGFFAGREGFTFYPFSIPTGQTQVIKVISPIDTIVSFFGATLNVASLRVELVVGGTEGGTFNTPLPILKTNMMTTASDYSLQVSMNAGGTHTGGMVVDIIEAVAGVPAVQASQTNATESSPFGFAPGTYYIRLINTDGATAPGIFRARWEEQP